MNAVLVEAVPACSLRFDTLQIALTVELASVVEDVMFARNEEHVLGSAALQHLIKRVELLWFSQLCDVSGVNEKRRRRRHRVDAIESDLERFGHVFIRILGKADVTVADLQEAQVSGSRQRTAGLGDLRQGLRYEDAPADCPKHAGAGPGHAF